MVGAGLLVLLARRAGRGVCGGMWSRRSRRRGRLHKHRRLSMREEGLDGRGEAEDEGEEEEEDGRAERVVNEGLR